jgi:hypothetical protein
MTDVAEAMLREWREGGGPEREAAREAEVRAARARPVTADRLLMRSGK